MKKIAGIVLAAAVVAFVGCPKSDTGGPGKSGPAGALDKVTGKDNTFALEGHTLSTSIKQGEKKEFEIDIARKNFKQTVTFKFEAPPGIKVDFKDSQLKDPNTKLKGFIEVDEKCTLGDHMIKVTATPETGDAAHEDYTINVKAK